MLIRDQAVRFIQALREEAREYELAADRVNSADRRFAEHSRRVAAEIRATIAYLESRIEGTVK